jgi:hypothetical protein
MADYRDEIEALQARIESLEAQLAEARGDPAPPRTRRCPYCARAMVSGRLEVRGRFGGATGVVDLHFHRAQGGDEAEVDRYGATDADSYCEDCCTVIVRGRFTD